MESDTLRRLGPLAIAIALITVTVPATSATLGPAIPAGPSPAPRTVGDQPSSSVLHPEDCTQHPPILINEEHGRHGFTWTNPITGEEEYRPGSGVVAGTGTAVDPYVIEGWCIQVPEGSFAVHLAASDPWTPDRWDTTPAAITLEETDAHVVVRNNALTATSEHALGAGTWIDGARNVTVERNHIERPAFGTFLYRSTDIEVRNNRFENNTVGIDLEASSDNDIVGNVITSPDYRGIHISTSKGSWEPGRNITIRGNTITDPGEQGAIIRETRGALVESNVVTGGEWGIWLIETEDAVLRNNTLRDSSRVGLLLSASLNNTVEANVVTHSRTGVKVEQGIFGRPSGGNVFLGNNIAGNQAGLNASEADGAVEAAGNWWGHESGPSGGVTDACTGTLADGDGDEIVPQDATVCFDPWLQEPNPEAGAG